MHFCFSQCVKNESVSQIWFCTINLYSKLGELSCYRSVWNSCFMSGHRYTDVTSAWFVSVQSDLLLCFETDIDNISSILFFFKNCDWQETDFSLNVFQQIHNFYMFKFRIVQHEITTVMFLSFRTDRSGQTVQTQIRLCTVCHSVCIVWTHYSMVEPHSSNFRVITTNSLGVRIFRKFMVLVLLWSQITP